MTLKQSNSPPPIINRVLPCSPSTMTSSPGEVKTSSIASMTMPISSLLRLLNRMLFSMRALMACFVSGSLGMTLGTNYVFLLN